MIRRCHTRITLCSNPSRRSPLSRCRGGQALNHVSSGLNDNHPDLSGSCTRHVLYQSVAWKEYQSLMLCQEHFQILACTLAQYIYELYHHLYYVFFIQRTVDSSAAAPYPTLFAELVFTSPTAEFCNNRNWHYRQGDFPSEKYRECIVFVFKIALTFLAVSSRK